VRRERHRLRIGVSGEVGGAKKHVGADNAETFSVSSKSAV
jgi:hypothetical protein